MLEYLTLNGHKTRHLTASTWILGNIYEHLCDIYGPNNQTTHRYRRRVIHLLTVFREKLKTLLLINPNSTQHIKMSKSRTNISKPEDTEFTVRLANIHIWETSDATLSWLLIYSIVHNDPTHRDIKTTAAWRVLQSVSCHIINISV